MSVPYWANYPMRGEVSDRAVTVDPLKGEPKRFCPWATKDVPPHEAKYSVNSQAGYTDCVACTDHLVHAIIEIGALYAEDDQ